MTARSIHDPEALTFYFNGMEVRGHRGQSVAAALIAAGERVTRSTRIHRKPRGVFCGIGVCFDCLVIVDGVPNQRACLTGINQGMQVETQNGPGGYELGDQT